MAAADDVYDSWEDMDDIGLDRKITNFLASVSKDCPRNTETMSSGSVKVVLGTAGTLDPQMMTQQLPAVKILKRPVGLSESNSNGENKQRPVKTFQQRQQEYEQARLRILGEAKSPEDVAEEMESKLQIKTAVTNDCVREKPIGILTKGSVLSNGDNDDGLLIHQSRSILVQHPNILVSQRPNLITVLRSPRGPDGTRGFLLKR